MLVACVLSGRCQWPACCLAMKTDVDVSGLRVVWWMLVACVLSGGC